MTVPEIIDYFGYPSETISTTTVDGYILVLHRIPWGKGGRSKQPRPVVFLQHGLLGSSADWTTNIPSQSAAYVFADAGYDVWMGNVRGNVYSCDHVKYSRFTTKYWDFSFDEMAAIDLPTMINTVINITGQEKIYYIGHSQGTLIMFAGGPNNTNIESRVEAFFALAPVNTVAHIKGLMPYIGRHIGGFLAKALKIFGSMEFMPSNVISKMVAYLVCGYSSAMCDNVLFQIAGPNSHDINAVGYIFYFEIISSEKLQIR
uniref:Abhydro_lipase domain-containing protein n=1 Tax=Panagrellus redivivus TaxID=6233 RepID=A0A7E4VBF4_PANRE